MTHRLAALVLLALAAGPAVAQDALEFQERRERIRRRYLEADRAGDVEGKRAAMRELEALGLEAPERAEAPATVPGRAESRPAGSAPARDPGAGSAGGERTPGAPAGRTALDGLEETMRAHRASPMAEVNRILSERSALLRTSREERRPLTMAETLWVDRARAAIESAPGYAGLGDRARADLGTILGALSRFEGDGSTGAAASNLAWLLEEGRLAGAIGERTLAAFAALVRRDDEHPGNTHYPYTSDAILALALRERIETIARDGGFPARPSVAERIEQALTVTREVRGNLNSSNRAWGGFVDGAKRVGASAWDVFSLGTTRLVGWARGEPAITDQDDMGIARTRRRTTEEGVPELEGGFNPDARRRGIFVAARMGEIALEEGWGNCMECSAATAWKLHEMGVSGVEILHKLGDASNQGNHAFVVIDRDPNSDPGDPSTWGDRAIVVDSWAGAEEVYRASEAATRLPGVGAIQSHGRLPDPVGAPRYH